MSNCPKCNEKLSPFYLKQNSYDWDVMEKIVGEFGLESYFSDKYTLEEQREEEFGLLGNGGSTDA